jgi:CheY-like chemotaxis protein
MSSFPAVLYVEDDPRSRKVLEVLLKREMMLDHVSIFEDSADFVARVNALTPKPDIVLLDIHVKPYNGFEMLNLLRGIDGLKTVPVVALTASVMNEEVIKLREVGFHSVIAKPVDVDAFPDVLERILRGESIWRIVEPG